MDILQQMEEETSQMLAEHPLNRDNARFSRTKGGFVSLEYNGNTWPRIAVYRAFPFTDPERYISIREPDEKAKEIGMVQDLNKDLDPQTAELLREQLRIRYFTPKILKIQDIKEEYGFAYFKAVTEQGPCRFTIHMSGSSVVRLSDSRILLSDLDGNRFEIEDLNRLSESELHKLDLFI